MSPHDPSPLYALFAVVAFTFTAGALVVYGWLRDLQRQVDQLEKWVDRLDADRRDSGEEWKQGYPEGES